MSGAEWEIKFMARKIKFRFFLKGGLFPLRGSGGES
jgi:hypothetical protein